MNWKMCAVEKLKRYAAMAASIENIPDEIERLKTEAGHLREEKPIDEDSLMDNYVKRHELSYALSDAKSWVKVTDRALGVLQPDERLVLHRMYICPDRGNVERLCAELNREQSSIYRKRDSALKKFTVALYGTVDW